MAKTKESQKAPSKTQVISNIAERTGFSKKDVQSFFQALSEEIEKSISKKGPGTFVIPGLCKVVRKSIPARPAERKMVLGQMRDLPAKPSRTTVKVRPLKALKEMAG